MLQEYGVLQVVDSNREKRFMNFGNCGHGMHFVWKQQKVIHSLDFYFADCVKSVDTVFSFGPYFVAIKKKKSLQYSKDLID